MLRLAVALAAVGALLFAYQGRTSGPTLGPASGRAASSNMPERAQLPLLHWVPISPRTSYWVELKRVEARRSKIVLTFVTNTPQLHIPRSWYNAGRLMSLAPGTYRWSVWPLRKGETATPKQAPWETGTFSVSLPA
jgi:streptogramin lyase